MGEPVGNHRLYPEASSRRSRTSFCDAEKTCNNWRRFFNNQAMASADRDGHTEERPPPLFVTTHWSVVLAAGHGDTTRADDALAHLCQTYWYPLYA